MRTVIGTSLPEPFSTILRWLRGVISILALSVLLSPAPGVIALEVIALGPNFRNIFIAVPVLSVSLAILLDRVSSRRPNSDNSSEPKFKAAIENWGRSENSGEGLSGYRWRFIILCALASATLPAVAMVPSLMERLSRQSDAEAALRSFVPTYGPGVEQNRLERTLAEFERSRRELSDELSVPERTPPITLWLFNNLDEYRKAGNVSWSGGFAACFEDGVTIGVPLEEASDVFSEDPHSGTPMHEMVHAMVCQGVGHHNFISIQNWFHEGVAKLYENAEISMLHNRILNRVVVWVNRDRLLSPEAFCNYRYDGSGSEVALFYQTSWEFIRSLEAGHGRHTLIAIVDDVAAGSPFEDSLIERLGGTCTALYAEWTESL